MRAAPSEASADDGRQRSDPAPGPAQNPRQRVAEAAEYRHGADRHQQDAHVQNP